MHFFLFTVGALVAGVAAVPAPALDHVVHEKRDSIPAGWTLEEKLDGTFVLPMRIALTQPNLDKADGEC